MQFFYDLIIMYITCFEERTKCESEINSREKENKKFL
jgi:hypothetical protein